MPSDHDTKIVPFGKYQGRSVEELVADDSYARWLTAQDWFRTRYATLCQVVINKGAEPTETPEHNAIQVKFLDDAFCKALLKVVWGHEWAERAVDGRKHNSAWVEKHLQELKDWIEHLSKTNSYAQHGWDQQRRVENEKLVITLQEARLQLAKPLSGFCIEFDRQFEEKGTDVILTGRAGYTSHTSIDLPHAHEVHRFWNRFELGIEIKPTIGDDYPAVLRQMKANRSAVLLMGRYTGVGATQEQMVLTFSAARIRVVTLTEVEVHLPPTQKGQRGSAGPRKVHDDAP